MASTAHLLVLCHGLWGNHSHMFALRDAILERYNSHAQSHQEHQTIRVICAASYAGTITHDGIDILAERVLLEIESEIGLLEKDGLKLTKFSIAGRVLILYFFYSYFTNTYLSAFMQRFSLGGLIARYILGILETQGFFNDIPPVNFATFASPAIGIPMCVSTYQGRLLLESKSL